MLTAAAFERDFSTKGADQERTLVGTYSRVRLFGTLACALILSGCPVDDRDLVEYIAPDETQGGRAGSGPPEDGGDSGAGPEDGGSRAHGGAGGGASSFAGNGAAPSAGVGQAGRGGAHAGTDACPDLDGNGVSDCEETTARNARFDVDTQDWSEESGLSLSWSENDARRVSESGALVVENTLEADRDGQFMGGARQCVEIPEPAVYRAAADIFVPMGQSEGSGGIQLLFYADVGCTGQVVTSGISGSVAAGTDWKVTSVSRTSPPGIKSAALRLVAVKPFREKAFKVIFDNVLVRRDF